MNANETPREPEPLDVADQNVARLLGLAYLPEEADAAFVERLEARLHAVAEEAARARVPALSRRPRFPWRLTLAAGLAAALLGPTLLFHLLPPAPMIPQAPVPSAVGPVVAIGESGKTTGVLPSHSPTQPERLTARVRLPAPAVPATVVGETVTTGEGERKLAALPDGSLAYLNEHTTVQVASVNQLQLKCGQVYVDVAPRPQEGRAPFTVCCAQREVEALGTKFAVRAQDGGAGVVVTQGKVKVSGLDGTVVAGQQLEPEAERLTAAPRASHVLDWTKDLMVAADAPLMPRNPFAGGALVARDPNGKDARLSLRKYHLDVHVEDGFARTTIDQTYFNHETQRLEGTFHFPLPPDASLSRLAMYVDGVLMEGGMVEREHGRAVFESIVRKMKDPALLEWVDGSTFKMRVFPLEGRQEKRIVLSYTQKLPTLYGKASYRFPAGHSLEAVRDWSFHAHIKNGARLDWSCDSHTLKATQDGADLVLDASARQVKVDRDVRLTLSDTRSLAEDRPRFSTAEHEGAHYLMLRYRPSLVAESRKPKADGRHWIFLYESSADRDPLLARVQVEVIRTMLNNAEHSDTFSMLTAGTRVHSFAPVPLTASTENIKAAIEFLEGSHLIGLLDLGQAFGAAVPLVHGERETYFVHVGSGTPGVGELREDVLAKRVPEGARYVGVGVGKRWARGLMKAAAERTGGHFTQINPDEPVVWRAFDLFATLNTPRLLDVQVVDNAERAKFLAFGSSLCQGEELCAIARLEAGQPLPEAVSVSGTLDGKAYRQVISVRDVAKEASYLPRTWAKLEIERLLAEDAVKHKDRLIALSKAMYVMTPFTSLLVLENDAMYAQYNVDRGRKDHWAMYACPPKIPVVHEPLSEGRTIHTTKPPAAGDRPSAEQVLRSILVRVPPRILTLPGQPDDAPPVVTAYDLYAPLATPWNEVRTMERWLESQGLDTQDAGKLRAEVIKQLGMLRDAQTRIETTFKATSRQHLLSGLDDAHYEVDRTAREYYLRQVLKDLEDVQKIAVPTTSKTVAPVPPPIQPTLLTPVPPPVGQSGGTSTSPPGSVPAGTVPVAPTPVVTYTPATTMPYTSFQGFGGGGFNGFGPYQGSFGGGFGGNMGFNGYGSFHNPGFGSFQGGFNGFPGGGLKGPTGMPGLGTQPLRPPQQDSTSGSGSGPGLVDPKRLRDLADVWGRLPELERARAMQELTRDMPPRYRELVETYFRRISRPASDSAEPTRPAEDPSVNGLIRPLPLDSRGVRSTLPGSRFVVPMLGPAPIALDFGLPVNREAAERGQVFAFWLGYFSDQPAPLPKSGAKDQTRESVGQFLYRRPSFSGDGRIFTDLAAYAPGLNTQWADILAVLEAESAADPTAAPGTVEPAARRLIDRARLADWRTLTTADDGKLTFDGSGRFVLERTLPVELREQVFCDGKVLLHLYPEIGLGSRRDLSRFHRAELAALVPWLLPPVEDLARGADLRCVADRTVALVPHGSDKASPSVRSHLVFAEDGRLVERRLVMMPGERVLASEAYAADGSIRVFDANGRKTAERPLALAPAKAPPSLRPDTREVVVLPLPLRTSQHVLQKHAIPQTNDFSKLPEDRATALLSAVFVQNAEVARQLVSQRFLERQDHRPGFYALLAAAGVDVNVLVAPRARAQNPVGKYLERLRRAAQNLRPGAVDASGETFLARLASFRELSALWQSATPADDLLLRQSLRERTLDHLRGQRQSALDWALLGMVQDRCGKDEPLHKALADSYRRFEDVPAFRYAAGYERARLLLDAGDPSEAGRLFQDLHTKAISEGTLPLIDRSFCQAFRDDGWLAWVRQTAARLAERDQRLAAFGLIGQCRQLGDPEAADQLLNVVLEGIDGSPERLPVLQAAVAYLWQTHQHARADEWLRVLLKEPGVRSAELWRLGARLAEQRKQTARSFACLEQALEIEYQQQASEIDPAAVRRDYGTLLGHYEKLAGAWATLGQTPPADFGKRVVRAADRWRLLDTDAAPACQSAAKILRVSGQRDLAWDYLTTAIGPRAREPGSWLQLAQTLQGEGDRDLADRAYALAFESEPTNAQVLWERVHNLQQDGRPGEALPLLHRLAEGAWPAQFEALKSQARQQIDGPSRPPTK